MTDQRSTDMQFLMDRAEFRRFLFRSIQTAGILAESDHGTHGSDGRDLAWREGRRSLGFFLLREAEAALPPQLQRPADNLMTLLSVLSEESRDIGSEKKNGGRTDRYGDDDGGGGGGGD